MFELYFEKDRTKLKYIGGHRHEVETVIMYFTNGLPTHVAVSAHGDYSRTRPWSDVSLDDGRHPKVVYYSDTAYGFPVNTHSFRFANPRETAQNTEGRFVFPVLASWACLSGQLPYDTSRLQSIINSIRSFELKIADRRFLLAVNNPYKPAGYPVFT
jgi:hypothetical protein